MERRVFRRTGTAVFSALITVVMVGVAITVTVVYESFEALVAWAVALLLGALAVVSGILPRLVTTDTHVEVHNLFTRVDIPYPAVAEAVRTRRGVSIRPVAGRPIPVVGFGRSSLAELANGDADAKEAVAEVNARVEAAAGQGSPATITKHPKVPVIVALLVAVAFVAAALWAGP